MERGLRDETERRGIQQKTGGVLRRYDSTDYGMYGTANRNSFASNGNNSGFGQYGGRRGSQTQKIKRLKVNEMSQWSKSQRTGKKEC